MQTNQVHAKNQSHGLIGEKVEMKCHQSMSETVLGESFMPVACGIVMLIASKEAKSLKRKTSPPCRGREKSTMNPRAQYKVAWVLDEICTNQNTRHSNAQKSFLA